MLKCDNFLSSQTGIRTKEDTVVYSDEDVIKNVHQDFVIVFGVTFVIIISIIVVVFCLLKLTVRVLQNRQHIKVNRRTKLTLCNCDWQRLKENSGCSAGSIASTAVVYESDAKSLIGECATAAENQEVRPHPDKDLGRTLDAAEQ